MQLLVVCQGNYVRSPALAAMLAARLPQLDIASAGVAPFFPGKPAFGPLVAAMQARGFDLSAHRCATLTRKHWEAAELILAVDMACYVDLSMRRPEGCTTPFTLLSSADIPDPFITRDMPGCLDAMERAADAFALQMRTGRAA